MTVDLLLLTDYRGALRQRQQIYESLDVDRLCRHLAQHGIQARTTRFEDLANGAQQPRDQVIHYTSSQDEGYRGFVDDVLFFLHLHNRLVPRYELFRAHENKGFQELLKRELGMEGLPARYLGNEKGLDGLAGELKYPLVFKPASGFMSTGVSLVHDEGELRRTLRRVFRPAGLLKYRAKQWLKRHVLKGRYRPEMYEDCPHSGRYVLQEFVPGAGNDWKVLVFADHYFVLKRQVRPGDFRASGSGRFDFATPPDAVLDFARRVFEKLDVPMLGMDIIAHQDRCHLVEFQAMHFGTITLDRSPHRFEPSEQGWRRIERQSVLEEEYARALAWYLQGR